MKKNAVILFFLAVVMLAVTCSASAWTYEPNPEDYKDVKYSTKVDYFHAICVRLNKLRNAVFDGNNKAINAALTELRQVVYNCVRFLAERGEYDGRLMEVLTWADKAAVQKPGEAVDNCIKEARYLAWRVLIYDVDEEEKEGGFGTVSHS